MVVALLLEHVDHRGAAGVTTAADLREGRVSARPRRMNTPTPTRRALARNGTRQPHARNAADPPLPTTRGTPRSTAQSQSAGRVRRRCRRGHVVRRVRARRTSARLRPTRRRGQIPAAAAARSAGGAQTPIASSPAAGRCQALKPISISDHTSIDFRPMRSPKCPMTIPPIGRAMNPTPKVAKDARVAAIGETCGKNLGPRPSLRQFRK